MASPCSLCHCPGLRPCRWQTDARRSAENALFPELMIKGDSLQDRDKIAEYVKTTSEVLILNQVGMPLDGADDFMSQILTPINTYTEIIVHGDLRKWVNFLKQSKLPDSMENYRKALSTILRVEWGNIEELQKILR